MRAAVAVAGRDVRAILLSPFGIGTAAGFEALAGVLLVVDLRGGQARLDVWFSAMFFALGLLAALLTMRAFAEEERTGTLELLLTAPLSSGSIVAAKLVAVAAITLALTAATVTCPILVATMGHPDAGPIITGYTGVVLVGVAFLAVGLAVSAATANPLVAATGTAALLLALWFGGLLGSGLRGRAGAVLSYLSPANHVTGFLRGTLSLADVVFFLSLTLVGTAAAVMVLRTRR